MAAITILKWGGWVPYVQGGKPDNRGAEGESLGACESWFEFADEALRLVAGQIVPSTQPDGRHTHAVLVVIRWRVERYAVRLTTVPPLKRHPAVGR